eukprot:2651653-Pleurochrysis_carterae.AAC.1
MNHVFSEEERSRLPDALRDAPPLASRYAFSVSQVAEERVTVGEQADLDALLDTTLAHVLATDQTFAAEKLKQTACFRTGASMWTCSAALMGVR